MRFPIFMIHQTLLVDLDDKALCVGLRRQGEVWVEVVYVTPSHPTPPHLTPAPLASHIQISLFDASQSPAIKSVRLQWRFPKLRGGGVFVWIPKNMKFGWYYHFFSAYFRILELEPRAINMYLWTQISNHKLGIL